MKLKAGNIDSFCSKLSQSNLKGLLKMPCEISDILSMVKVRSRMANIYSPCLAAFSTGGSPTCFGLVRGPITPPDPAMVRTDWKDLNSNKKNEWSRKAARTKNYFKAFGTWFIITFSRRIEKSKPFYNLTPCKSSTEKGRVNPGSCKVKFSSWHFLNKICVFLN